MSVRALATQVQHSDEAMGVSQSLHRASVSSAIAKCAKVQTPLPCRHFRAYNNEPFTKSASAARDCFVKHLGTH